MRLSTPYLLAIVVLAEALAVGIAGAVLPGAAADGTNLRLWLMARATGLVTLVLLTVQVSFGILLSHPSNAASWKLSKRLFPWHENLSTFLLAFSIVHVVSLVLDPYAKVGVVGALLPGGSEYRPVPVAVGTLALYAGLLAGVSARWTRLLPAGIWLRLHRLALVAWIGAWVHGVLAGTDTLALTGLYAAVGVPVVVLTAWRFWVVRPARRTAPATRPAGQAAPAPGVSVRPDAPRPRLVPVPARAAAIGGWTAAPSAPAPLHHSPVETLEEAS